MTGEHLHHCSLVGRRPGDQGWTGQALDQISVAEELAKRNL